MDNIKNTLNFEINENRPILDNFKVNDSDNLNGSAEKKLSAAEPNAFLHGSPLTEKQVLSNVNNNIQNDKPNISFTVAENSLGVISDNSRENIASLSSEVGTSKGESMDSFNLSNEIPKSNESSNNISCWSMQENSGCGNELKNVSGSEPASLGSNEIPGGNVDFPQDALSYQIVFDNQKNLSINAALSNDMPMIEKGNESTSACTHELNLEKNNSFVVVPDLDDFTFREQESITDDLLEGFSKLNLEANQPEPSPNNILEQISGKNPSFNVFGKCAEILETDTGITVPISTTKILEEFGVTDTTLNSELVLQDSISTNSPLSVSENPVNEVLNSIMISGNLSAGIENPNKAAEEISTIDSGVTNTESSGINSDEATHQMPVNTYSNEPDKVSPLRVGKASFGMSDSGEAVFQVPENTSCYKPDRVSPLKLEKVSLGISDKSIENFSFGMSDKSFEKVEKVSLGISDNSPEKANSGEAAFQVPESTSSYKPDEISPLKKEKVSLEFSDNSPEKANSGEAAFQVPKSTYSYQQDEISPLKKEKVSLGISDNSPEKANSGEAAFQVSESTSSYKPDEISPLKKEKVLLGISDNSPAKANSGEAAFQVPESTSSYKPDEVSPLKKEKVSLGISDNSPEKANSGEAAFLEPESTSSNKPDKVSPLKIEKVSLGILGKSPEKVNSIEAAFQVPENTSITKPDVVSPMKSQKNSFGVSNKSLEDPEIESKVPDVASSNLQQEFSDTDFAFKVPEVPSINPRKEVSDIDSAFKVPEAPSSSPIEQFYGSDFGFKMLENPLSNEGDEQFVDAVQFFKDPNSFQFLENIRTSNVQPGPTAPRSSLYVNFDPLHSKFQTNMPRQDNCALITAALENSDKCGPEVVNKTLVDVAARESLGNILISFDSPKSCTSVGSKVPVLTPTPPKVFTEEEVQQILKIHQLETQDTYIKKQREMEMEIAKRDGLLMAQHLVLEEFCRVSAKLSEDVKMGQEKILSLGAENEKQKDDLKTSAEDLQSVENTFADFYKRYEACKGMLKTYKDNEEYLKQTNLDLQAKAKEQEQMYQMLQERTEEMLEKANLEVDNAKHAGDAQVTVLKAQLKKAEMKISSLESDIKQIKIENSQLGGLCDDLMAKVGRS